MSKRKRRDFQIKKSTLPNAGNGLFSRVKIKPGDIIGEYTGKRVSDEVADEEYTDNDYILHICPGCNIVGDESDETGKKADKAGYTRFINHHPYPNVQFVVDEKKKKAWVESMEHIDKGEELFVDYGEEYWEIKKQNETIDADPFA